MNAVKPCTGPTRCHEMAGTITDILLALVRERAVDGMVAMDDVEKILQLMRRGTVALDNVLRSHEEACRKEHQKPRGNIGARSNPLQRLMVRPFEHLLMGDKPAFKRVHLPNYFAFYEAALGERLDAFERQAKSVIQALLVIHGNNLTWDHFYADARTVKLLHAALKLITHQLAAPEGQRLWAASMIRPVGDVAAPTIPECNVIREALLETHRGLSAA
ncbi:MAG: hypothetical protein ACM33T_06825 [Solirubrobacterales bacterium]